MSAVAREGDAMRPTTEILASNPNDFRKLGNSVIIREQPIFFMRPCIAAAGADNRRQEAAGDQRISTNVCYSRT